MDTLNKTFFVKQGWLKAGLLGLIFATLSSTVSAETFYRVKAGDTLNSIANQYNVSVQQLVDMNNLASANDIKIGDLINVKDTSARNFKGQTVQYIVQPGDSFSSIAKKFNTSVSTLAEINSFPNDKTLYVADKIYVPFTPVTTVTTTTRPGITITSVQPTTKSVAVKPVVVKTVVTTPAPTVSTNANTATNSSYIVKSGDTLIGVADKFNIYTVDLAKLNNLQLNARLNVGQKLLIPAKADRLNALAEDKATAETKTTTAKATPVKTTTTKTVVATTLPKVNIVTYSVKAGESLSILARRYNTTNADLARMNKLEADTQLLIGQKILVPVQSGSNITAQTTAEKY